MPITFQFQKPSVLKGRTGLKEFIRRVFLNEGKHPGNISFVFCSDEFLLDINKRFLKHDFYTDIITFDLSESAEKIDAEIFISTDRVSENAKALGHTFSNELHRVMIHGVLHLCGYKDKNSAQIAQIRKREDFYLAKGGFT